MQIKDFKLREAMPSDKPHLLLWDKFDQHELRSLAYFDDAEVVSYRQDLLKRISPSRSFLALHENIDSELNAIRRICNTSSKKVVILRDLDCLITYLHTQPESPITLFWQKLFYERNLENIIWILLPSKLAPPIWTEERLQRI
jgi:hypothetical protein